MRPMSQNPLLELPELPAFDVIEPAHVEPAMRALLATMAERLAALEATPGTSWETLMIPLEDLIEPVSRAWGVVKHLLSVRNRPELRSAHDAVQSDVVQGLMRVEQSAPIYQAMKAMATGLQWERLDAAQRRILESSIQSAERAGVGLQGSAKLRFSAIATELAELATRFNNNVLDATKAFALELSSVEDVEGLPASARARAAQAAGAEDPELGPWKITLDAPSFVPFLEHSTRRDLREQIYRAFISRASSEPHDNQPIIKRILELRHEKATLLGFESFAAMSLAVKMAPDVAAVELLLEQLRQVALPAARAEQDELTALAARRTSEPGLELALWDVPYWAERLREERYAYSEEDLRPYFSQPRVLEGLFATAQRLFQVTITAADGQAPVWHPDVRFFRVADADGTELAGFYLDPFSRPGDKRGGAWMNAALDRMRRVDGSVRAPIAYLICNATPPVGERPALMTFIEVETLFHEFGHGLQHMLTEVDHPAAAGIRNIEWDAVELPSQFMENWCYRPEVILPMARHVDTGQTLPEELFAKILAAKNYRAAYQTARQVYFATLDLELHNGPIADFLAVQRRVAAESSPLPPLAEDRFLCSFGHIFAGGYAAGYYSYKWAEVLSADAFAAFEEAGLDDPEAVAATGRRFRETVLALGGSRPPSEVFEAFRGRGPDVRALLEHTGLSNRARR